jgi:adenosylcobinamide-phosphate synthase
MSGSARWPPASTTSGTSFRLVLLRDGGKTESPNAGRPMAALAGLLGVELEKVGHYRLGDPATALGPEKIAAAWRVVSLAGFLAVALSLAVLGVLHGLG